MNNNLNKIKQQKKEVRKNIKGLRSNLSAQEVRVLSNAIVWQIKKQPLFIHSKRVAFYVPTENEVQFGTLMNEALRRRKQCYVPRVSRSEKHKMAFYQIHELPHSALVSSHTLVAGGKWKESQSWQKSRFNILEPRALEHVESWTLSLVFMPLVAFDKQGTRLGMGGGYYDSSLASCRNQGEGTKSSFSSTRPALVGVGYDFQQVASLPIEATDIKLDYAVTESGWQEF